MRVGCQRIGGIGSVAAVYAIEKRSSGSRSTVLAIVLAVGCLSPAGLARQFAGGSGEPNDPYQIATAEQLISIGRDPNSLPKHYVLVNDIDLDPNLPGGRVFTLAVVGTFGGSFDGEGYAIRNLVIRAPGRDNVALFGYVKRGGQVKNLGIENTDITGTRYVGGLAGLNGGTVSSCYSTGHVTGREYVGGLVGCGSGMISASYSTCTVTGTGSAIGGLVGSNDAKIVCCYSTGRVTGQDYVGGLVGNNAVVYFSYSMGHVTGTGSYVGGLVGLGSSKCTRNCFFLAPVDGGGPDNCIGGALTASQMRQRSSFAGWDFWGTDTDGTGDQWFMATDSCPALVWQTGTTGLRAIPAVAGLSLASAQGVLREAGFVAEEVRYDFHRTIPKDLAIHTYPSSFAPAGGSVAVVLSGGPYDSSTNPGDGTAGNPYEIQTASQLESLADHPELWDRHFVLTTDVDLAGTTYSAALVAPDTNDSNDGFQGTAFTGSLDGQGHKIWDLSIATETGDYLGLFGMVGQGAQIENLDLENIEVLGGVGSYYVAPVAGFNAGTISGCTATGSVSGHAYISGPTLVGYSSGIVTDCQAGCVSMLRVGGTR